MDDTAADNQMLSAAQAAGHDSGTGCRYAVRTDIDRWRKRADADDSSLLVSALICIDTSVASADLFEKLCSTDTRESFN